MAAVQHQEEAAQSAAVLQLEVVLPLAVARFQGAALRMVAVQPLVAALRAVAARLEAVLASATPMSTARNPAPAT